jgi:hypothetical protein
MCQLFTTNFRCWCEVEEDVGEADFQPRAGLGATVASNWLPSSSLTFHLKHVPAVTAHHTIHAKAGQWSRELSNVRGFHGVPVSEGFYDLGPQVGGGEPFYFMKRQSSTKSSNPSRL